MPIYFGGKNLNVYFKGNPLYGVYYKGQNLLGGIQYDYITSGNYNEIDFLYTTDTHLRWLGNSGSDYKYSPTFSLQNLKDYKDRLWNNGIPTFALDCGDFIHSGTNTESLRDEIINYFNNFGSVGYKQYLAVTWGNHEWYGEVNNPLGYLNRIKAMSGCNLIYADNSKTVYKPYRAIKIGNTKIGIIAVGYPSPNDGSQGTDRHPKDNLIFLDALKTTGSNPTSALNSQVQYYIDLMQENNFNYIFIITHMDKYADENFNDDPRFNSRADLLLKNTHGANGLIPGHYNYEINNTYTFQGTTGQSSLIFQEAGANLYSFGRIRVNVTNNTISSYLLKSQSDLNTI